MKASVRVYPSTTALPSALSSAFAAGAVEEPGAEGGVGIVPGTFFIFLGGADIVYCGAGRRQTNAKQTMRFLERMRYANSATSLADQLCEVEPINE